MQQNKSDKLCECCQPVKERIEAKANEDYAFDTHFKIMQIPGHAVHWGVPVSARVNFAIIMFSLKQATGANIAGHNAVSKVVCLHGL